MSCRILITRAAEQDLIEAADYIEYSLKNPSAAKNLLDRVSEEINRLSDYPLLYPPVDDPVLRSWGIRFVTINHYLAFYTVDEEARTITIVRFLYGKRDWTGILKCESEPAKKKL